MSDSVTINLIWAGFFLTVAVLGAALLYVYMKGQR